MGQEHRAEADVLGRTRTPPSDAAQEVELEVKLEAGCADTPQKRQGEEDSASSTKYGWLRLLLSPTALVVEAVLLGGLIGVLMSQLGEGDSGLATVLALPGKLWLKALKCVVLPMIVFSMIEAMVMMRSLPNARTVGFAAVGLYTLTTVAAAVEGCVVAAAIMGPLVEEMNRTSVVGDGSGGVPDIAERTPLETLLSIFTNLVPGNLVADAAQNRLLPAIVASIIFGLLVQIKEEDGSKSLALQLVAQLNQVVVSVVTGIMTLTPLGVCSLVFASCARLDLALMGRSVGLLVFSTVVGLGLHLCVLYPSLLLFGARRNPLQYGRNLLPAMATALGTSSSAATLPVSTACAVEKNGIAPHVANFVLSLGATINMDGTSLYLINAVYFLGRLQGVHFDLGNFITMAILATFCSMGTAPVPSASLVLLATIMTAVGVPFNETFGLISAVDWMLDRLRTVVNVCGDATVAAVMMERSGAGS